jgi:hypothetical protein
VAGNSNLLSQRVRDDVQDDHWLQRLWDEQIFEFGAIFIAPLGGRRPATSALAVRFTF